MHCATVNQTHELLSANLHFQLQKLMQFCFCLCRTAMRLCHCCMAATMFVGYCKCSIVHIYNEWCTKRCRNNFHLILAFLGLNLTRIFFIVFVLVLSCFGAHHCLIAVHPTNIYVVPYMQCPHAAAAAIGARSCFLQHETCKFMISHDFECMSALYKFLQFLLHIFYTIIVFIALFCICSICIAC